MLIVDRIHDDLVVLEQPDRTTVTLPLSQLPPGLKEGDCLRQTETGYQIDPAETTRRRNQNQALFKGLLSKD